MTYLKIHDPNYPRNKFIRRFFDDRQGFSLDYGGSPEFGFNIGDVTSFLRAAAKSDVLILAEFQLKHAVLAKIAAKTFGCILVVDGFVGRHETEVGDWGRVPKYSLKSVLYRCIDDLALVVSDVFLVDTKSRASGATRRALFIRARTNVVSVPVGVREEFSSEVVQERHAFLATTPWLSEVLDGGSSPLRVLYYGDYIPLHGAEYAIGGIVEASRFRPIDAIFIGENRDRATFESSASRVGPCSRIRFLDRIPFDSLQAFIAAADIILGVFGESEKASSVVPNKVWEGLAAGKVVVTRESSGLREIEDIAGKYLIRVGAAEPREISQALISVDMDGFRSTTNVSRGLARYAESEAGKFLDVLDVDVTGRRRGRNRKEWPRGSCRGRG